jgi:hypothetical protein
VHLLERENMRERERKQRLQVATLLSLQNQSDFRPRDLVQNNSPTTPPPPPSLPPFPSPVFPVPAVSCSAALPPLSPPKARARGAVVASLQGGIRGQFLLDLGSPCVSLTVVTAPCWVGSGVPFPEVLGAGRSRCLPGTGVVKVRS